MEPVMIATYNCFSSIAAYRNGLMKRRSLDRPAAAEMQAALKKTLDLFDGDAKDLLLFYLYKEHRVSVYEPESLSRKKIESAFSTLFGKGGDVLMEKFNSEIKNA
jgi:predicted transcriptional regulator